VVNKDASCEAYYDRPVTCESIPLNTGRAAASALQYVISHYDELPDVAYFVPTNDKYNRLGRLAELLQQIPLGFDCISDKRRQTEIGDWRVKVFKQCLLKNKFVTDKELLGINRYDPEKFLNKTSEGFSPGDIRSLRFISSMSYDTKVNVREKCRMGWEPLNYWPLSDLVDPLTEELSGKGKQPFCKHHGNGDEVLADCADFSIDSWEGVTMPHAWPRPFSEWYDARVANWDDDKNLITCYNMVFQTTRDLIRKRSLESYTEILADVAIGDSTEAEHYVERAVPGIFGASSGAASRNKVVTQQKARKTPVAREAQ